MKQKTTDEKNYGGLGEVLKQIDLFGKPMPGFNLRGKDEVNTSCGGFISLVILFITIMFGCLKLSHLMTRKGPTINTYVQTDAFSGEDHYNTVDNNFMVAFSVEDYLTYEFKNDPRYVKWFARYLRVIDGVSTVREVPMHPCTDEDYGKFFPVDDRSSSLLGRIR